MLISPDPNTSQDGRARDTIMMATLTTAKPTLTNSRARLHAAMIAINCVVFCLSLYLKHIYNKGSGYKPNSSQFETIVHKVGFVGHW